MRRHVYIVEMLVDKKWHPCAGIGITRDQGRFELKQWRKRNPDDVFRLAKYIRYESSPIAIYYPGVIRSIQLTPRRSEV